MSTVYPSWVVNAPPTSLPALPALSVYAYVTFPCNPTPPSAVALTTTSHVATGAALVGVTDPIVPFITSKSAASIPLTGSLNVAKKVRLVTFTNCAVGFFLVHEV